MIVITGATGTLGRIVVEEALKVYPANELGVKRERCFQSTRLS